MPVLVFNNMVYLYTGHDEAPAGKDAWKNKFHWFAAVTPRAGEGKAIGSAISESPTGPFKDALGKPLIDKKMIGEGDNFDPLYYISDGTIQKIVMT